MRITGQLNSTLLVAIACVGGLAAFIYPFLLPLLPAGSGPDSSRNVAAPVVFALVSLLSLGIMLVELASVHSPRTNAAKVAALLGAIVALDASLRLVPSLGGASPIFMLIIVVGSVFGARLGFLTGSMTLLLSALLTGGVGPWLPYQMLGAGWVGLGAGLLPRDGSLRIRIGWLVLYGIVSALLYGLVLNLYSWPFAAPGVEQASSLFWSPGLSFSETIDRYARFYLVTSLSHDAFRAAGNAILLITLGVPIVKTLERANRRFSWHATGLEPAAAPGSRDHGSRLFIS